MKQPIDFGLHIRVEDHYPVILRLAQEAERQNFRIVSVNDHLLNIWAETKAFLEAWTLMTAIGVQTGLRITHTVLCNSFRNPALLAKMTSTLDVITNGRFELGIGAGEHQRNYGAYGYEFPKASIRIQQLKEAVQIITKLWTEPETTFRGKFYRLERCINFPKPVQKPHPPLMIGGAGDKLLKVATEFANEINIPYYLETINDRIALIYKYCDQIGRDPNVFRISVRPRMVLATDEKELELLLKQYRSKTQSKEEFLSKTLVGTPEIVLDRIYEYIELGISRFLMVILNPTPDRLQLFSNTVVKLFE